MITIRVLVAAVLLTGLAWLNDTPVVRADPLVPPSPSEIAYLEHLHRSLPASDPVTFHNDGWFLDRGWEICRDRDLPKLGYEATLISPIIAQSAYAYLCPN